MADPIVADIIFRNANIITLDPALPRAELVAVRNGKIAGVGQDSDAKHFSGSKTKTVDCRGKTIVPGFIDAHCHLHSFAESLVTTNLGPDSGVKSISDIQKKIRELSRYHPPGSWIKCGGYNEFCLSEKRHPNRWDLDIVGSVHPIKLTHRTGHAHVLNSLALKIVGVSTETPDPDGGLIERDIKTGEPTGLLYGMSDFLSELIPRLNKQQLQFGIKRANIELLSLGITSIQDASHRNDIERWHMFQEWKSQGQFKPRISMLLGQKAFRYYHENNRLLRCQRRNPPFSGVKIILDQTTGLLNPAQKDLNELVFNIHKSGLQAVIHAIEEPSIETAIDAIAHALKKHPRSDHRHRIDHCSVCPPALSKRMGSLGIMVVTQPSFIYYNGDQYLQTVPNYQLKSLYPIGSLMRSGVHVAGSSDCPIVPPNPLVGIYSAISRMTEAGQIILEKEAIPRMKALQLFTHYAARAVFEEEIKGSITPGKLADLVVLNGDPTKVPTEEIKRIQVEMTILNGEVVWDRKKTNR